MNDLSTDPSVQESIDSWPLAIPPPEAMKAACEAVVAAPQDMERWEELEALVEEHQRPDVAESVYGALLSANQDRVLADQLGARAVRFHDEWSGDPETLVRLLRLVLRSDISISWAFERLTMTLTMGERWSELLELYDHALRESSDLIRRREILDEAAHIAKDFAGDPDRAIGYLWQLLQLRPSDGALASSLERLLESKGKYRELIQLWSLRASVLDAEASRGLRLKAALCWVDRVGDALQGVLALEPLLAERHEEALVVETLRRQAALESAPAEARIKAYSLLEAYHAARGQEAEELEVLEGSLGVLTAGPERARRHRRAALLLEQQGEARRALEHLAQYVPLQHEDGEAIERLRRLGERTEAYGLVAEALAAAASAFGPTPEAWALKEESAGLLAEQLNDRAGAGALLLEVFWAPGAPEEQTRRVGERLRRQHLLLPGLVGELLPVLERLVELGPGEHESDPEAWREELLGEVARVARSQGHHERALWAWEQRLAQRPGDAEAIHGRIDALEQLQRWEPLVQALQERADRTDSEEARRQDLVRIAKVMAATVGDTERAIESWRSIEANFGRGDDTVDALAELYEQANRVGELRLLLEEAEAGAPEGPRRAELKARLGELAGKESPATSLPMLLAALAEDPRNSRARRGLWALLEDASCASQALAGLVEACEQTADWQERLALLEFRLQGQEDEISRADLLLEAASDLEHQAQDFPAAQQMLGRALELNPGSISIERDLLRLAEQTGLWKEAASALAHGLASAAALVSLGGPPRRAQELRARLGDVLENRTGDFRRALDAYREVALEEPRFPGILASLLRVSTRLEQAEITAEALGQAAQLHGHLPEELLAIVEGQTSNAEAWLALTQALDKLVQRTEAPVARHALLLQLGRWHREFLQDPARAESLLEEAAGLFPSHERTLEELAELQRRAPGRPLIRTLRRLSAARGGDEVLLREGSELALSAVGDPELGIELLEELRRVSIERWLQRGDEAEAHRHHLRWAQRNLTELREQQGDFHLAIQVLQEDTTLPFSPAEALEMLQQAAGLAMQRLGDTALAATLYRKALVLEPADTVALQALSQLYKSTQDHAALIGLLRHELSLDLPLPRRIELRLELATTAQQVGDQELHLETLRANLQEHPGHAASLVAAAEALASAGRYNDLLSLYAEQASTLERLGESPSARSLWLRAAEVAEQHLGDANEALKAQMRAHQIEETLDVLDALGRLHMARCEYAAAVPWFERRLSLASLEERPAIVQRLAAALAAAGRTEEARLHLEALLREHPQDRGLRSQLASLYRSTHAWPSLVELALSSTHHEEDAQARIGLFLEAAEVLLRHLNDPARAVDLLRQASDLAPQDRALRTGLADALRASGQLDAAQQTLEGLLSEFGRRRPPERAAVHFQLAQLAQARGDTQEALTQLDTAAAMDMSHGGVLLLLGRSALDAGQLERAERAFRALLLLLRRHRPDAPLSHQVDTGVAELSFELYGIALQLGQPERAAELLESAFETAAQSPQEATKLERALRQAGQTTLLLRALTTRLARATTREEQALAHHALAVAHEQLEQPEEAFAALEQALRRAPQERAFHETALRLAGRPGYAERHEALLRGLASAAEPKDAAYLWLCLGSFHESRGQTSEAAADCEQACTTGFRVEEAHRALIRLYGAQGNTAQQLRSQRALVDLLSDGPVAPLAEALYDLARTELSTREHHDAGAASLERAVELLPRYSEALTLLQSQAAGSTSRPLLSLYERIARQAEDRPALLDALERLYSLQGEDQLFREAAALADQLGHRERAEAALLGAVQNAQAPWAMIALAERYHAEARWAQAQQWFQRAADALGDEEGFACGVRAATLAADPLNNSALAVQSYLKLWQRRPEARRVWEPLLALLRKSGDTEQLDAVLAGTAAAVEDPVDRRALRMERAEALLEDPFRQEDAIAALQEMLQEDPSDGDAQALLLRVYEQTGRTEQLTQLLRSQLEDASQRRALEEVSALALRLGALLARSQRDEAIEVYRLALGAAPDDSIMLRELLALLGPDGSPQERAEILDRLLLDDAVPDGALLASQLADAHEAAANDPGVEAALRRGLALAPDDAPLRARIEKFYTSRQRWRPLAELLLQEAENNIDPQESAVRLHQAARILGKQLGDAPAAVEYLRKARGLVPEDMNLLRSLVDALLDAGQQDQARAEVNAALERTYVENTMRAQLLRLNALLALRQGKEADAVAALEQALDLGAQDAAGDLLEALGQQRTSAARQGDTASERAATLRLAELHIKAGSTEQGLGLLRQWIQRQPDDLAALRTLLDLETAAENWPAVIDLCNRLIASDPEETKVDAALRLQDACARLGAPADARMGLEQTFATFPRNARARTALRQLYEQLDAQRELADILLHEAADIENEAERFAPYRRAAELYLASGFAPNAIPVLEAALHAKPGDHDCTVLLTDCYIAMNQLEAATNLLDAAMNGHKNKRSPQLSTLQHRMARIALAAGDRSIEVQWLNAALDSDGQNTQVAAELADSATEIGQYDLALKALRAITVAKNPGPMSKGMAFYRQGLISYHQGDQRKAIVMARRGLQEDASLAEARTFLEQLGEKV
jgi:tetratricopeptide (TPR) repeat protein